MKDPEDIRTIHEVREAIDEIDFRILKLFEDRNRYVKEIVSFKKDRVEVIAIERQKEMLAARRKWASDLDLNPELYEKLFKMIIKYNIKKELIMLDNPDNNIVI